MAALADRYRIECELGAGGMATVYLAEDLRHHRKVALKVLRDDLTASLGNERFLREISIAAGLTHPHILPLHDSGEAGGQLFYVMPFVDGPTLRQRLLRVGELPIADAVRVLRDIADAMAYAHKRGIVHRDLKPENVMLTDRHALVTDFGVAKALSEATGRQTLTTAGVALGTPAYMSPEQATADPHADQRSDIYSFGVVAYELLTGRTPFGGGSPQEMLAAHVTTPAAPVTDHRMSIPPALAVLVMKCLEKKPADRWQSAEDLILQLEALLTLSGGITPHETAPYAGVHGAPRIRGRRAALTVAGLIVVVAVAFGFWRWTQRAPGAGADKRVVVAWFDNRTGDSTLKDVGSLAAEWLTDRLTREGAGTLIPATVVRELMSGELAAEANRPRTLASRTQATYLVTGRYDARGDSLEYRAEVLDVRANQLVGSIGPVRGTRADTRAFDALAEQVFFALDMRRKWGGTATAQWQRPTSLAAYREYTTGYYDHFVFGRMMESVPFMARATVLDSMWLAPRTQALSAFGNFQDYRSADSVRAAAKRAYDAAPPMDKLAFDWVAVRQDADYEAQYRVGKRMFDLDSVRNLYHAALPAARTGRASEVLYYAARRDTALAFSREWRTWDLIHLWALHALGRFEEELRVATQGVARRGLDLETANWVATPLAAMGRAAEVDSLFAKVKVLPATGATPAGWWAVAGWEYLAHGHDEALVRAAFQHRLDYIVALPPTERVRYAAAIAQTLVMLQRLPDARVIYDSLARARPDDIYVLGALGALAATQGDIATANDIDTRLAKIDRPHLFAAHTLWRGRIAALSGDCSRAATLLRTALSGGQDFRNATHHQWAALGKARGCKEVQEVFKPRD